MALALALTAGPACRRAETGSSRSFATPEDAVKALIAATASEKVDDILQIFGPEGKELIDASDPSSARRGREVFSAAAAERWSLTDTESGAKTLVMGNEDWPFPVPLVREAEGWRFDTAAGAEEIVARRDRPQRAVGDQCLRNLRRGAAAVRPRRARRSSLAASTRPRSGAIPASTTACTGPRPGRPPQSARRSARRSGGIAPPGELRSRQPAPFHGYYFRVLTAQGAAARGGAKSYIVNGEMTGGFALVAWPAQYDVTGVMTFIVGDDGVVRQKDLGTGTDGAARAISVYDPDGSWAGAR